MSHGHTHESDPESAATSGAEAPLKAPQRPGPDSTVLASLDKMKPGSDRSIGVIGLIVMNVVSSVSIVAVNKILVENYGFKFILLLTCTHFLAGYAFLQVASSESIGLFKRATAPANAILKIAIAGMGSIVLLNYSLRFNSMGTYQILKVAVLPTTIALTYLGGQGAPSRSVVAAASLVVIGTLVCTVTDVTVTLFGVALGVAGVLATAQYQIFQGSIQKQCGLTSTQALHLMSLPQAGLALLASLLMETAWPQRLGLASPAAAGAAAAPVDIWSHHYSLGEVGVILATCVCAVLLNYSTIGVIGKTSAVAMQFVAQLKTVLVVAMSFLLFPRPEAMTADRLAALIVGLGCVFAGVAWYTKLQQK